MAPNTTRYPTGVLYEDDVIPAITKTVKPISEEKPKQKYELQIVWRNVIIIGSLHLAAIYGAYLMLTSAKILTILWATFLLFATGAGVTSGAHRLWAHRGYKAKWPLRLILMIFNTMAFQNHIYEWARDHRVHHKYSETDADPHNSKRGFFFSHVGWLLVRKHPDVLEKGKGIDMSDIEADPIVRFQMKYYLLLMPLLCFVMPAAIPVYLWRETWLNSWLVPSVFRYVLCLNITWLVNSAAHLWGGKPYDKYINPRENFFVNTSTCGEGWHNYHHVFPWDYKTAELGSDRVNFSAAFIDFFARFGWAYDLKTVPLSMVLSRVKRTGDGSHAIWGWGDKDMSQEDIDEAQIINNKSL